MSEPFADDLRVDTGAERDRRVCVPKSMQRQLRKLRALDVPLEHLRERLRMDRGAILAGEHEIKLVPPVATHCGPFEQLPALVVA
jgi:hypothetical protein